MPTLTPEEMGATSRHAKHKGKKGFAMRKKRKTHLLGKRPAAQTTNVMAQAVKKEDAEKGDGATALAPTRADGIESSFVVEELKAKSKLGMSTGPAMQEKDRVKLVRYTPSEGQTTNVMAFRPGSEIDVQTIEPHTFNMVLPDDHDDLEEVKATAGAGAAYGDAQKEKERQNKYKRRPKEALLQYHLKEEAPGGIHLVGTKKKQSKTQMADGKHGPASTTRYYVLTKLTRPETGEKFFQIGPVEDYVEFQKYRDPTIVKSGGVDEFEAFEKSASQQSVGRLLKRRQGDGGRGGADESRGVSVMASGMEEDLELEDVGSGRGKKKKRFQKLGKEVEFVPEEFLNQKEPDAAEAEGEWDDWNDKDANDDSGDELAGASHATEGVFKSEWDGSGVAINESDDSEDEEFAETQAEEYKTEFDAMFPVIKNSDDEDEDEEEDDQEKKEKAKASAAGGGGAKEEGGNGKKRPREEEDGETRAEPTKRSRPGLTKEQKALIEASIKKYLGRKPLPVNKLFKKLKTIMEKEMKLKVDDAIKAFIGDLLKKITKQVKAPNARGELENHFQLKPGK